MKAQITSASHVWPDEKTGLLRVRVDFFPGSSDPLYDGCHVQVPERGLTPQEEAQLSTSGISEGQSTVLKEVLATIPNIWGVNPIDCRKLLLPVGFTWDDLNQAATILEGILAGIPKVWRVNPINCHMFLLPLGFTQNDLLVAVAERMPQLKAVMSEAKKHGFKELRGFPNQMCYATRPPKGEGQALIPTVEKEWTPTLVEQAGSLLNGLEVQE